ncbi:probable WRKY transcription factor 14 [Trifolium pratense]|uniref:probable WRKY transcription factor 14 n=1 Tax=Trifolium pratense TaxID=57577 RepID=UPI001E696CBA|nr:probable WRKY transcription factor 14 [Trifolium pratense]
MDNVDWDLSSIVRSCKSNTFANPPPFCETPPQNLTTTITTTTNSIVSPVNITPLSFDDSIFNQENSSVANTQTMDNDWDLTYIVRSCKATTFTNPSTFCETPPQNLTATITATTTNSRVSPINTTPSCFVDITSSQENSSISFTPLKPNDSIDLNKLRASFNSTTHIPTATSIPITFTSTTSIHITPNTITNNNTSVHVPNENSTSFDFSTLINQHQMQPSEFIEKDSFISIFNPTTSILTLGTTMTTSAITPPTTFTTPTTTINTHTITPTHRQQPKRQSRKRKNKNLVTSVCHVKVDKLSEDQWQWRKYGQKPVKGSPHSRNYYKCSGSKDCPARKQIEKSKIEENTYVVTYRGKHNHQKPEVKQNSNIGTSRNNSSEVRLPIVRQAGSSQIFKNLSSPNVGMVRFDQSESNIAQVLDVHSKIELNESQSHVVGEAGSSQNVQKIDTHNMMVLQRDELERSNAQNFLGELEIPYSETNFIENNNDDDDILIPNMSVMSKDFLLDFNHLNGGYVLP